MCIITHDISIVNSPKDVVWRPVSWTHVSNPNKSSFSDQWTFPLVRKHARNTFYPPWNDSIPSVQKTPCVRNYARTLHSNPPRNVVWLPPAIPMLPSPTKAPFLINDPFYSCVVTHKTFFTPLKWLYPKSANNYTCAQLHTIFALWTLWKTLFGGLSAQPLLQTPIKAPVLINFCSKIAHLPLD